MPSVGLRALNRAALKRVAAKLREWASDTTGDDLDLQARMQARVLADRIDSPKVAAKAANAKPPGVRGTTTAISDGFVWEWDAKRRQWVVVAYAPPQMPDMSDR